MLPEVSDSEFTTPSQQLVAFAEFLRDHQFACDPSGVLSAHTAARVGYLDNRGLLHAALKSCLCQSRDQWTRFDSLFDTFFQPIVPLDENVQDVPGEGEPDTHTRLIGFAGSSDQDTGDTAGNGAGDYKGLSLADFRFVKDPNEYRAIELMIDTLARRMRQQFQRKTRPSPTGHLIDLRRSMRDSLATQGVVMNLHRRARQRRLPRFVVLLDVSQSMESYAKLFLRYTRQILAVFDQTRAYAFNIELIKLADGQRGLTEARFEALMNNQSSGWLGGTRIAASLENFNTHHLRRDVRSDTTVVIFSDGSDTAQPDELAAAVAPMARRARKLIWVNPLLGRWQSPKSDEHLEPVKPLLDAYCSGHNLQALAEFQKELLG